MFDVPECIMSIENACLLTTELGSIEYVDKSDFTWRFVRDSTQHPRDTSCFRERGL